MAKTAKWVCTILALSILAIGGLSYRYTIAAWRVSSILVKGDDVPGIGVTRSTLVSGGVISETVMSWKDEVSRPSTKTNWKITRAQGARLQWEFQWWSDGRNYSYQAPLWAPFLSAFTPAVLLWCWDVRAMLRRRRGVCRKCSYSRRGLAQGAKCPECGTVRTLPSK